MTDNNVETFLEHHGVKGMRWGIRKSSVGMTPQQRDLAIYGSILAVSVLAAIGKHRADSGIKDAKRTGKKPLKQKASLKGKKTVEQLRNDIKHINPDYGAIGTKMNCRRATLAYEMRRRGYDVKATKSNFATGQGIRGLKKVIEADRHDKFQSLWGETKVSTPRAFGRMSPVQKADTVFKSLSKYPNGARGEIGASWIMGGGHSMAFEIVNKKPVVFDAQNGAVYRTPQEYSRFTATVAEVGHTRLDNKPIDQDRIKRWVTDV